MAKTLIVRYHRIGDAIIVLPLVYALAKKYPEDSFTVLSYERFESLFKAMPPNVSFEPMVRRSYSGVFRGVSYLIRRKLFLARMKSFARQFDKIAFLQYEPFEQKIHESIRESGKDIQVEYTDEKPFLSEERLENKCWDGMTMIGLHKYTLSKLGYTGLEPHSDPSLIKKKEYPELYAKLGIDNAKMRIAIAPFSKEKTKIYPLDRMEKIVAHFAAQPDKYQVLILGGGIKEKNFVDTWVRKFPNIISLIDTVSFAEEVILIAQSSLTLSMDSANLHLASFMHTPVFSIWGATAPQNGFYPSKENIGYAIIRHLDCQPCSIFGGKPCARPQQYECLDIAPEEIISKMEKALPIISSMEESGII